MSKLLRKSQMGHTSFAEFSSAKMKISKARASRLMVQIVHHASDKTHHELEVDFFKGSFHVIATDKPTPRENQTPIAKM